MTERAAERNSRAWPRLQLAPVAALLAGLAGVPAHAQQVKPHAALDTAQILIGQQAHLELSVTYRVDSGHVNIQWPAITDTLAAKVPVLHDSHVDTILPDKAKDPYLFKQTRTLTITSWDSGFWAIPPFQFVINGDTVGTEPLLLTVHTVAVDTTKAFRDIKEIYTLPFSLMEWLREQWPWVAGGLALVAVLTALIIYLRKRKRRPKPLAPEPPKAPLHVRTLLALEALQQKKLWEQDRQKEYHSELTDILRGYIEERYGVRALEQTSEELLAALRLSSMPSASRGQLAQVLRLADMVKFAKWKALPAENEQAMSTAVRLVQETAETRPDAPLA